MNNILITGGAGFIGTNFVHFWREKYNQDRIVVLDALTYAGNIKNIENLIDGDKINFIGGDICDTEIVSEIFESYEINLVVHFAAESHVDRSIKSPDKFIKTNIMGTHVLLNCALNYWGEKFENKRFHHISTDEVYGELNIDESAFTEMTAYSPRSPYAASKAASDMLVNSYYTTYGLPITISNCSNNYGPYQFPEKLIPLIIYNVLNKKKLPIYGKGLNVRDWIYVEDHCEAINLIIKKGRNGETYNIGGENQIINIDLVNNLCDLLDEKISKKYQEKYSEHHSLSGISSRYLIEFVKDRPGHDKRYAINMEKIKKELNFLPKRSFEKGLEITLDWYFNNEAWLQNIQSGDYKKWIKQQYKSL